MSKHTPGPWCIDGGTGKRGELYIWEDLPAGTISAHAIATVHPDLLATQANAALIAAAPDLLETLEGTLALLIQFFPRNENPASWVQVQKARAAIRKAEGV